MLWISDSSSSDNVDNKDDSEIGDCGGAYPINESISTIDDVDGGGEFTSDKI